MQEKKRRFQLVSPFLVLTVMLLVFVCPMAAQAATKVYAPTHARCGVGMRYRGSVTVQMVGHQDTITKLKTSKNLKAKVTYTTTYVDGNSSSAYATISFYAKTKGTQTIKFNVTNNGKGTRTTRTIKVHAYGTGSVVKSVKIGSTDVTKGGLYGSGYTSAQSGKVKFTLGDGYKLKSIKIGKYDQNGTMNYSKFKNGSKVKFGTVGYSYTREISSYYGSIGRSLSKDMFAPTYFEITYTDSYSTDRTAQYKTSFCIYRLATKWP